MNAKTATALFAGLLLLGTLSEAKAWGPRYWRRRRGPVVVVPVRKRRPKPVVVIRQPVVKKVVVPASYETIIINDKKYHYGKGKFYRMRAGAFIKVKAPRGAVVSELPTARKLEIVDGKLYYIVGKTYYRKSVGGYRVVKCPYRLAKTVPVVKPVVAPDVAVKAVPEAKSLQTKYTTWLENSNGSKTPVELTRHPSGTWVGPKGEHYDDIPSADQLRTLYGL